MAAKVHYEFGGPIGALGVILGLPLVIYLLFLVCNKDVCLSVDNMFTFDWTLWYQQNVPSYSQFINREAVYIYVGWMLLHVLLERVLPGETVEGVELPEKGGRLKYVISGHLQFWVTLILMGHAIPVFEVAKHATPQEWLQQVFNVRGFMPLRLDLLYDNYLQLITVSVIFTTLFSIYL